MSKELDNIRTMIIRGPCQGKSDRVALAGINVVDRAEMLLKKYENLGGWQDGSIESELDLAIIEFKEESK